MTVWVRRLRPFLRHLKHQLFPGVMRLSDQSIEPGPTDGLFIKRPLLEEPGYVDSVLEPLNPDFTRRHAFADRALWYLRDVDFFPGHGFLAHGRRIIGESKTNGALQDRRGPFVRVSRSSDEGLWLPLGHQPWNYYHWLIEDLPVIIRGLEAEPLVRVALPASPPGFVTEGLSQLGVRYQTFSRPTRLSNVVLPGRGIDPGWPHRTDVRLLEEFGQTLLGRRTKGKPRRVMVSRKFSTRGLDNEEQLEQWALAHGFEVAHAERMSFADQVSLFSEAAIVLGSHGAGLSNTVFSSSRAPLIEVASPRRADPCFENLARIQNRPYRRVFGTPGNWLDSTFLQQEGFRALESALSELSPD